jgi:hypothetical protein
MFFLILLAYTLPLAAQITMTSRSDGENVLTPGLPFLAERVTHIDHKLIDGNEISSEEHEVIARDADGRFYDMSMLTSSSAKPLPNAGTFVIVADPVTHTTLSWSTFSKIVTSRQLPASVHLAVTSLRPSDETAHLPKNSYVITTQDLGKKTIAGLAAIGIRSITTIPAGNIGNARDIVLTHDVWTSTDLQITISESDSSPVSGTRTSEITAINRTAPPSTLFDPPAGYTFKSQTPAVSATTTGPPPQP